MNTKTLSTGSIVSYKGKLYILLTPYINLNDMEEEDNDEVTIWSEETYDITVSLIDLSPIPITFEILDALGFEKANNIEYRLDRIQVLFDFEPTQETPTGISVKCAVDNKYTQIGGDHLHLHDLQHLLKLVPEIEWEITLEQLKDVKI